MHQVGPHVFFWAACDVSLGRVCCEPFVFPERQAVTLTIAALLASLLAGGDTLRGTVVDTAGHPLAAATVSVAELGLTLVTKADGLIYLDVRVRNATNTRYTDFLSRYKVFAFGEGRNVVVRLSTGL
jgi:hypothetical protein